MTGDMRDFKRQNNIFLNSVKERDLRHPFLSIVLSLCINFAAKVFCECTHFLKKSFPWTHPFLRKVFSGYTLFEEKFSLDIPILKKSFL